NAKPAGTGPVKFVSWTKDDKLVLDGNDGYWGGKPDFDRMTMRPIPETAPRIAALLKGEVDIITQLPPDQGERVAGNPTTRVVGALYAGLYVLAVNSKRPPLDNPLIKQALSLAIDREAIVKELWRGRGIVPSQPIAKGDNHWDASLPALPYKEMTAIFFEHFPWLPVIQPYEDYGMQKYVDFTPNPNQQFEVRKFNLKLKRA